MNSLDIMVKLRKIIRSINLESKKLERNFNVSIPQLLVLQFLSQQEDYKASSKDIKEFIKLNASTVSGIVGRLEKKGFVAKVPRKDDKRSNYITLTAKGADLMNSSPTTLQEKITERLSALSVEQLNELGKNIDLLVRIMDAEEIDASPVITIQDFSS